MNHLNLASKRQGSFTDVLNSNKPSSKSKFRSLLNSEQVENADVVIQLATFTTAPRRILIAKHKLEQPVMLDAIYTSTMFAKYLGGRKVTSRALIDVSAEKELKQEVIMAVSEVMVEQNTDGFTTVTNRKKKGKQPQSNHARNIEGLKLNKPKATFVYRPKISEPARTMETTSDDIDLFKIKNQFDSLRDQDDLLKENELGKTSGANAMNKDTNLNEDSESDVEEVYVENDSKGASTPSPDVNNV
ncbi:hypothetical protein Tco_0629506 [Tanacetum coccineum]|uniref:Uncharacterized protein n=1 Tax=Tanacetum coccineum TaxID=301880 RepID=A0ABQ4WTB1_9ASTR